jgi:hypothetical protein
MPPKHDALLKTLQARFEKHPERHPGLTWTKVAKRIEANPTALKVLTEMEATGGEPDVVTFDAKGARVTFVDCAAESPKGRRSLCYDRKALDGRKNNPPAGCATDAAKDIGIELLDEAQYRRLQEVGEFDLKTSSWIVTPPAIRKLGGALFGDRRYDQVFIYHNGADSYYAARGFRGLLEV